MALFIKDDRLLKYIEEPGTAEVVIPEGVTEICRNAFVGLNHDLRSVVIPDTVTKIGDAAFKDCYTLKSVSIPDSVAEMGKNAFSGCSSLTDITIPPRVTTIESGAFRDCRRLKYVTFPPGVRKIKKLAFCGCSSLNAVTFTPNVTCIEGLAFAECSNLENIIDLDNSVAVEEMAFWDCDRLQDEQGLVIVNGVLFDCMKKDAVHIHIPDSVHEIGTLAFLRCTRLKTVTIPASVSVLGMNAFYRCKSLVSIEIKDAPADSNTDEPCGCRCIVLAPPSSCVVDDSEISEWLAFWKHGLTKMTIPSSVTKINGQLHLPFPKLTICAPKGSYALHYAERNGIPFEIAQSDE